MHSIEGVFHHDRGIFISVSDITINHEASSPGKFTMILIMCIQHQEI